VNKSILQHGSFPFDRFFKEPAGPSRVVAGSEHVFHFPGALPAPFSGLDRHNVASGPQREALCEFRYSGRQGGREEREYYSGSTRVLLLPTNLEGMATSGATF